MLGTLTTFYDVGDTSNIYNACWTGCDIRRTLSGLDAQHLDRSDAGHCGIDRRLNEHTSRATVMIDAVTQLKYLARYLYRRCWAWTCDRIYFSFSLDHVIW